MKLLRTMFEAIVLCLVSVLVTITMGVAMYGLAPWIWIELTVIASRLQW